MVAHTTQSLTFGTDPVAAAVRATFHSAGLVRPGRADTTAAGRQCGLDVDRLYPSLVPAPERRAFLDDLHGGIAAAVASLRFVISSL